MRYFFFQTSMQPRDGEMKPTLRALDGQLFDDGTPVRTDLNVQAPKDGSTFDGGARNQYPVGTMFCSTSLGEVTTNSGKKYYTVYENKTDQPNFHPVSDDPDFSWIDPKHKNDAMNIAFVKFQAFGDQTTEDENISTAKSKTKKTKNMKHSPADAKGKANPVNATWKESYDGQVETETGLIVLWMKKLLTSKGIMSMTVRPKSDIETREIINGLFSAGETLGTITSRNRFDKLCAEQKMDPAGLQTIIKGPLRWYLDLLLNEHNKGTDCSAQPFDISSGLDDAVFIIRANMDDTYGMSNIVTSDDCQNLKKAFEDGWTLDDIINPDIIAKKTSMNELCEALASGEIPVPAGAASGSSFIDTLLANKKNQRPKDKDGFHVEDETWNLLLRNLYRRKHTLLTGETGTGKTEIVRLLCERTGTPLTIIPMGAITDPTEQLVGKMDLDPATNGTKFDWADFALAIQRPGVVLLDEINRCPRNGYNILFSVLDGTAALVASGAKSTDQRTIKVNPECVFFATANIGTRYVGADEMDAALVNRFLTVELDYLSVSAETTILKKRTGISDEDANNIALVAANIRKSFAADALQHSVSTRETLECASLVADGFEIEDAMRLAFLPGFERGATDNDPNSERGVVKAMIATRFNGK